MAVLGRWAKMCVVGMSVLIAWPAATHAADDAAKLSLPEPQPLVPGAKVIALWPKGSPALRALTGYNMPEHYNMSNQRPPRVVWIDNIHNPSIEVHLAPPDKNNGMAVIVVPGGGNQKCYAGPEGVDVADWLNKLGINAFVERYRLLPYDSTVDALADTKQSIRIVRAHAKEWNIDPKRVGIMGFSAGGEQAAWVTLKFDEGNPAASDPIQRRKLPARFFGVGLRRLA